MNDEYIRKNFWNLVREKFPIETDCTLKLAQILNTSPETISQKLQGESDFTLTEAVKISEFFDISLDNLYNPTGKNKKAPLEFHIHEFQPEKDPGKISYRLKEGHKINDYILAAKSDYSTYLVASSTLPEIIYLTYEWLAKFYYIKWLYFNKGPTGMTELSGINFTDSQGKIQQFKESIVGTSQSVYIFNINMMQLLLDEIRFFYSSGYITKEEVKKLTDDLYLLLNEADKICRTGILPHTGKGIDIFYSEIHFANDLAIIDSTNVKFATILSFFLNAIVTNSSENFHIVKGWFDSLIRSSHLISGKGEVKRKKFLDKQQKDLDEFILEFNL